MNTELYNHLIENIRKRKLEELEKSKTLIHERIVYSKSTITAEKYGHNDGFIDALNYVETLMREFYKGKEHEITQQIESLVDTCNSNEYLREKLVHIQKFVNDTLKSRG